MPQVTDPPCPCLVHIYEPSSTTADIIVDLNTGGPPWSFSYISTLRPIATYQPY